MIYSQPICGSRQPIRGCSVPPSNESNIGWSWPLGWVSHSECTSIYIVTHQIKPIVSHDVRLLSSYEFTNLLHCIVSQSWDNTKFMPKLVVILIYGWDPKIIIYSIWIAPLLMKVGSNRYSQ